MTETFCILVVFSHGFTLLQSSLSPNGPLLLSFLRCDINRIISCAPELLRAMRQQQSVNIAILRNTEELCGANKLNQFCVNSSDNSLNVMDKHFMKKLLTTFLTLGINNS